MGRVRTGSNKSNKKEIISLKLFLINAKYIISLLIIAIFVLFSFCLKTDCYAEKIQGYAEGYVVINANSNDVLYANNMDQKLPMASTTKILTAILAIENLDVNKCIKININAIGIEGSSIYLNSENEYKILDLIYGLMLRSGNDAATALAYEVSGSVEGFSDLMNSKVSELGLCNSHFVNPHGLHDSDHYSSAYDMAIISSYAMKNPIFKQIVSTKKHKTSLNDEVYYNKNKMLSLYEDANGIKTGYTKNSGRCLVSSAEKDGVQVIAVVLNCPDMWNVSKSLLNNAFLKIVSTH